MKVVPLRLPPGADLRQALEVWMGEQQEHAGCLLSAVGNLSVAQLRMAGAAEATAIHGKLEILSLSGTLSPDGAHLHIAVAGSSGAVIGGPLCAGSLVRTTAELVIAGALTAGVQRFGQALAVAPNDLITTSKLAQALLELDPDGTETRLNGCFCR